ncbi:MAG TPA: RNA-binding cell elongation regulator Jag/EloR [Acidimicrobiales bacterium]|nr:RNA-binding cell elongation regulator Jag/EloR [Acidimicrobiales bacterium]
MEWVETTGRTVEEAKDAALDQLGVDEQDAEFQVLEEARSGLFGRLRQEARVRARVRPTTPRPKVDRRERRRGGDRDRGRDRETAPSKPAAEAAPKRRPPAAPALAKEERPPVDVDIDTQAANVRSFLDGLLDAFDATGEVTVSVLDEDTLEATVAGDDLGLLIGPKGQTLQAVQELTRAVLQKEGPGGPRLRLDVGGYRERRREALSRFTQQVAQQVLSTGTATSLEPMGAADRKVVHDTVNEIDGVRTISEGEEPRRRVVLLPDDE